VTVNEVIAKLSALPADVRELPLVASMWDKSRSDFHALGDVFEVYYEDGEFVQVMGHDPNNPLDRKGVDDG
jgi:antitoxin (DNA-binding transcriptional repressor) of toxin-antitoxin stability system